LPVFTPFRVPCIKCPTRLAQRDHTPLTRKMRKIQPPAGSKRAIIKAAKHRKGALFMKIFFYTLRPWDERPCAERLAAETGIAFDGCEAYPTLENAALAAGCDAVSMTPCDM